MATDQVGLILSGMVCLVLIIFRGFATQDFKTRQETIRKCGWPPAHLDADGDFRAR